MMNASSHVSRDKATTYTSARRGAIAEFLRTFRHLELLQAEINRNTNPPTLQAQLVRDARIVANRLSELHARLSRKVN